MSSDSTSDQPNVTLMETETGTGTEPKTESDPGRLVKRYANRKLYDTQDSRYVTLQQIAKYVREGEDVRIIDNTSKEDLTNVTLAQIIYEEEKKGSSAKRGRSLRSFIQDGRERILTSLRDGPIGKFVPKRDDEFPRESADSAPVETSESAKVTSVNSTDESNPPDETSSSKKSSIEWKTPKEAIDELSRYADDRMKSMVAGATGTVQQLQGEVKHLQERIVELETHLLRLTRRKGKDTDHNDHE